MKRKKRSYVLTLCDDDSEGSCESEENVKALVSNISSNTSSADISEYDVYANPDEMNAPQLGSNDPASQALFLKWQDDLKFLNVQKDRIEILLANNHRLVTTIADLKRELAKSRTEKESLSRKHKNAQCWNQLT